MEMRTCSFMLNGPGLSENDRDPNPGIRNLVVGSTAAMEVANGEGGNLDGDLSYDERLSPVHTGRLGSSVLVTVSRTSSMGESSSSSPSVALMDLSAVE
uniref:Uncharacterized protein n=1 Tax=Vitis vinifera TaxID=29760 RepID=A5B955_VITVI|nr:hypothetical protein VITISV_038683 [Vitis vinifera]